MRWSTHAAVGVSSLWLLKAMPPESLGFDFGVLSGFAVLGALLPDLDAAESKIKHWRFPNTHFKPFLLPSQVVHATDQHRGLLHSLSGFGMALLMALPMAIWIGWSPAAAFLLGYLSHLAADAATKNGIRLCYPSPTRYYVLPKSWRITTGSQAEEPIFVLFAMCALLLLLQSFTGIT